MKPIKQIQKEYLSIEELNKEIECRYKLIANMVGTLYPEIVYGEICEIRKIIGDANGIHK